MPEKGADKGQFTSLGLEVGDIVTLIGNRGEYASKPQVINAYYVSHEKPAVTENTVTFDFTNPASLGLTPAEVEEGATSGAGVFLTEPFTYNNVTFTPAGEEKVRLWTKVDQSIDLRAYNGGTMTFSVPDGYVITEMTLNCTEGATKLVPSVGTYKSSVWSGKVQSVAFSLTGTVYIASISVTYDIGTPKSDQNLSFSETECAAKVGESFTPPSLSGAKTTVSYSSSSPSVASVDPSSGAVTISGAGTTIITATAEETDNYNWAKASYTLNVSPAEGVKSVTFTVDSKTSVAVTGEMPQGASAEYSQTHGTMCQMTDGNSVTYTLKGFAGCEIKAVRLSMKSNKSGGRGTITLKAGTTTLYASKKDASFKVDINGAWSTEYVDIALSLSSNSYEIKSGEDLVLHIEATANSLYCKSMTVDYAPN